jgi:hypothetical protein
VPRMDVAHGRGAWTWRPRAAAKCERRERATGSIWVEVRGGHSSPRPACARRKCMPDKPPSTPRVAVCHRISDQVFVPTMEKNICRLALQKPRIPPPRRFTRDDS